MNIGNGEVIEVQHPTPSDMLVKNELNQNRLHLGPIGSGKDIIRSESERIEFAHSHGLLAIDVEMSPVLDSIIGNCRDSFILIKGCIEIKCIKFSNLIVSICFFVQVFLTTKTAQHQKNGKTMLL